MLTQEITIQVDEEAAKAYRTASLEDQKKMQIIVSLWLKEIATADPALLKEIMSSISRKAKERGLTDKILESLLSE